MRQPAAQLRRRGLPGQLVDQRVLAGGQHAADPLVAGQHHQPIPSREHLGVEAKHGVERGLERVEGRGDGVAVEQC